MLPWEQVEYASLLNQAVTEDSAVSLAPLMMSRGLLDYMDVRRAQELLDPACSSLTDATAAAGCRFLQLEVAERLGNSADQVQARSDLGLLDEWMIIGPFPNEGQAAMTRQLPPQVNGVQLDAAEPGIHQTVSWRPISAPDRVGYLDFTEFVQPSSTAAAVAVTWLQVSRPSPGFLDVAIDGAYQIWLNGNPIAAEDDHLGGGLLRELVPVELNRGVNELVIKVAAVDGPFGFHVRLLGSDERPLGFSHAEPRNGAPLRDPEGEWPAPTALAERLERALGDEPSALRLAQAAFVARLLVAADPTEPWQELANRARQADDPDATALYWLSWVDDQFWRNVEAIDQAHALNPDNLTVALRWIDVHRQQMGSEAMMLATREVASRLAGGAQSTRLELWLADSLSEAQMHYRVNESLDRARARLGDSFALLAYRIRAAERLERHDLVAQLRQDLWVQDGTNAASIEGMIESGRPADQIEQAMSSLQALMPQSLSTFTTRARILESRGDFAGALALLQQAITQCPGAAGLHEEAGKHALRMSDRLAAAAFFEAALELSPQNSVLREYLAHFQAESENFYDEWRLELAAVAEEAASRPTPQEVDIHTLAEQRLVRVYPNGLATTWVQQIARPLTRSGADYLRSTSIGYSPDSEVVNLLSIRVLAPDGDVREIYSDNDYGPPSGPQSMYFDVHTRVITFPTLNIGDTLLFEYTISDIAYRNIFDDYFGDMFLLQDEGPRDFVRYGVIAPAARTLYHNFSQFEAATWELTETDDGLQHLVLESTDVPAVPRESGAPGFAEIAHYASVSTYGDWSTLSDWYWNLVEDQLADSPEMRRTVEELTAGLTTRRERIDAIHSYVVRNTRYVGLEFGIHGYKPYRTTECFARRFGDCKDTASLLKVMLGLAGIESHLALVRTRDMGRVNDHPASLAVFNHVITWIPEEDLYLDGTAGHSGSAELPSMDQGASSLIVLDGEGGRWREIPFVPAEDSVNDFSITFDLTGATIGFSGSVQATGGFAAPNRQQYEPADQRLENFEDYVGSSFAGVDIAAVEFGGIDDIQTPFSARFDGEGGSFIRRSGNAWTLPALGAVSSLSRRYTSASTRRLPLSLGTPYTLRERVEYRLPAGATLSSLPTGGELVSEWGESGFHCQQDGQSVVCDWSFVMHGGVVAPAQYTELRQFLGQVDQSLDQMIRVELAQEGR